MSHPLISRSADLTKLLEEGYEVEIVLPHLLVRSVPYVNSVGKVKRGTLVVPLNLNIDVTLPPNTHVVMFAGEFPCDQNGKPLEKLRHGENKTAITADLVTQYSFSNKPPGGYSDYHHLVTIYVANISGPAALLDRNATPRTWQVVESHDPDSVFLYPDTASSRAGITNVARKLELRRIVIAGLGGTGSYVLDLTAKTPVREIHLYDGDRFGQHNAFRAPGAASIADLKARPFKVDYFAGIYARMRRGVVPHPYHLTADNVAELDGADFVFICMDAGKAKEALIGRLEQSGIPFIDVGMGLEITDEDTLVGLVRTTASTAAKRDHVRSNHRISFEGDGNDVYNNIQVADLNALNAALAVIKWKKLFGFYADHAREHFSAYAINCNALVNEDKP
ncbi:ThiF family adenylyltransferase [Bradyrhizobium sp. CCBAU 21360]|uniref:ThiF family adenylyltransferase n=1 Tax=Bradyrhizobium sp. CCBAU 21360 TaxID=1325081 RepID=UPI0023069ED8|nr:ThiF family adenylyltransferase [Bradyrhizobium sp. CCBAU 21360]MDA9451083.1 hypothetical protein [Bradyrhizobium sp. CCBAU 21360]